jgi:hypothetical protein
MALRACCAVGSGGEPPCNHRAGQRIPVIPTIRRVSEAGGDTNSTTLIPNTMKMELKNQSTGSYVLLSFQNVDYGGSNGTSQENQGVTFFLTNQGCN